MHRKRNILFIGFLILLVVPLVYAGTYGAGTYGLGVYGIGEVPASSGGEIGSSSGSSGGDTVTQSIQFDIKILDFESPIPLGESFDFTYFIKGVGSINNDVTIDFWIEKDGEIITSGSDVIFMGSNEEKTETAGLFLPTSVESGTYQFNIKVSFGSISAESHRTIELTVSDGVARVNQLFDISFSLDEIIIESSDDLIAVATFENFGTEPTSIDLTFIILDEPGNEVYKEEERITVETEEVLRKSFKGLDLPEGKYTLLLQTLYNVDVFDEFRQDFEIRKEGAIATHLRKNGVYYLTGMIIFILLIWIIILTIKLRKKKKSKKKVKNKIKKDIFTLFHDLGFIKAKKGKEQIRKEEEKRKKKAEQQRITGEIEKRRLQTLKRVETEKKNQKEFDIGRKASSKTKKRKEIIASGSADISFKKSS